MAAPPSSGPPPLAPPPPESSSAQTAHTTSTRAGMIQLRPLSSPYDCISAAKHIQPWGKSLLYPPPPSNRSRRSEDAHLQAIADSLNTVELADTPGEADGGAKLPGADENARGSSVEGKEDGGEDKAGRAQDDDMKEARCSGADNGHDEKRAPTPPLPALTAQGGKDELDAL
ncbi:hypothetical protein JCM8097_001005 [Rhodosporidiobolus ruineniae]